MYQIFIFHSTLMYIYAAFNFWLLWIEHEWTYMINYFWSELYNPLSISSRIVCMNLEENVLQAYWRITSMFYIVLFKVTLPPELDE